MLILKMFVIFLEGYVIYDIMMSKYVKAYFYFNKKDDERLQFVAFSSYFPLFNGTKVL